MEPKGSLPHSQVPATCPYPEPAQTSPCPHIPLPKAPLLRLYRSISPGPRLSAWMFCNKIHFCGEEFLAPGPTPTPEDHPLSAVHNCLFNIFTATFHIGGHSSIRNLRAYHAMVTGTHLSLPVLPHIHKFCNWTHLFKGLNIMGFTVWMEPLLEFVPREIV